MSTGYICDRCGAAFASGGKWLNGGYHGSVDFYQRWDLCSDCMEGFAEWMANDGKELRFANYGHDYGQIADMSEKSADCVRDGDAMSDIHESAREHSLESESVREQSESVRERFYESQDVTGSAGRVTYSPELLHDTQEKLEADVKKWCGMYAYQADMVYVWLRRQAAITEREVKERVDFALITQTANAMFPDYQEQVGELQAKVDGLTAERDQWRDAYGDSERMRLELVKDLERARKWNDTWRDLVRRYEGLCDELLDERDALRGEE